MPAILKINMEELDTPIVEHLKHTFAHSVF